MKSYFETCDLAGTFEFHDQSVAAIGQFRIDNRRSACIAHGGRKPEMLRARPSFNLLFDPKSSYCTERLSANTPSKVS